MFQSATLAFQRAETLTPITLEIHHIAEQNHKTSKYQGLERIIRDGVTRLELHAVCPFLWYIQNSPLSETRYGDTERLT